MRKTIIAGNWKMYKTVDETIELINALTSSISNLPAKDGSLPTGRRLPTGRVIDDSLSRHGDSGGKSNVDVIICPPFTSLAIASNLLKDSPLKLGAQNMSEHDEGAYTGEVSWKMLKSVGCEYVILGHSERRQYCGETNELINLKAKKALAHGLKPIVCVGEKLDEREAGVTEQIITVQTKGCLSGISSDELKSVVVAYEPVWAIGTGKTATPMQAQEVHKHIRKLVAQLYNWNVAEGLVIQYGGSVKPDNAAELLAQDDIDGALVGGACLNAESFSSIIGSSRVR